MSRTFATALSLSIITAVHAEPTAARFADQTTEVRLQDVDPAFPPIIVTTLSVQEGGAVAVGLSIDVDDGSGSPACAFGLVEGARAVDGPWSDGPQACTFPEKPLVFGTPGLYGFADCPNCDFSPGWPRELVFRSDRRSVYILRYRPDTGSDWTYGWIVAESIVVENLTCNAVAKGCSGTVPFANIVAAGFAGEPGDPIAVGSGLCESDLTFDGILDLSDLQLFVENFLSQRAISDRGADGVYDLADVQAFIDGFVAGCS
jgi:hypothetical protein